jgi:hypothetical protein
MGEDLVSIGERITELAAHIDAAMHRVLSDIRAFDIGRGWDGTGAISCAHWLSWKVGWDLCTARDRVRVARRLAELPQVDDALRRAEISYSKARAMARVATAENEEMLLGYARKATASELEKICRKLQLVDRLAEAPEVADARRRVTKRVLDDGMVRIDATLRPEEAAIVWAAIERAAKQASGVSTDSAFNRADGLVALARGERGNGVELVVTLPRTVLTDESDEPCAISDGTYVSADTARRLACDAPIVEVTETPDGAVVDVGRRSRAIPTAMRRALFHRDPTCRFPGCSQQCFVDAHHIEHWANGGENHLENLIVLCSYHHTFVHEHGYRIERDDQQVAHFFDPDGAPVEHVPRNPKPPTLGHIGLLELNAHLGMTPVLGPWVLDDYPPYEAMGDDGFVELE